MVQLFRFHVQSVSVGKYYNYRLQQYLRKGYVFTGVCLSTRGRCTPPWQADTPAYAPTRQTPPGRQTPLGRHHPPADGYCSRWYASYWNAFLFGIIFYFAKNCMKMKIGLKEGVHLSHPIDLPATAFPKYF